MRWPIRPSPLRSAPPTSKEALRFERGTPIYGAETETEGSAMFSHAAGFRPLWPVMLFLPWLLVGGAWLIRSLLPGEKQLVRAVRRTLLPRGTRGVAPR